MAEKRQRLGSSRLSLSPKKIKSSHKWEIEEEDALVRYVIQKGHTRTWPQTKKSDYWEGAADFVASQVQDCTKRTSERYDKLSVIVASCRCIVPSIMHIVDLISTVYYTIYILYI